MNKQQLIEQLELQPHIEGGYYRRSYSSELTTGQARQPRPLMSSIYYLLTDDSPIGHFHRNRSDIIHYWHVGQALTYHLIDTQGNYCRVTLGPNLQAGQQLQLLVPGGYWKASELQQGDYGLVSEAVCPGFDYSDMELASSRQMQQHFPDIWAQAGINLTRLCKH